VSESSTQANTNARAKCDRAIDPRTLGQPDQFRPFAFGEHDFGAWPSNLFAMPLLDYTWDQFS
jgi:hypothetical protein